MSVDEINDLLIPMKPINDDKDSEKWIEKKEIPSEISEIPVTTKRVATDRREDLIKLYWIEYRSPTQIMFMLEYGSSEAVIDDLKKYNIPTRPIDTVKTKREIKKQNDGSTSLWNTRLISDEQEIISETIDVREFRTFQLYLDLRLGGTPSFSYMKITLQFSVDKTNWFNVQDYPFAQLYELAETLPTAWAKQGVIGGDYMRLKFKSFEGDTLNSTNYFLIYNVIMMLS